MLIKNVGTQIIGGMKYVPEGKKAPVGLTLMLGNNQVAPEAWAAIKDLFFIKHALKERTLVVLSSSGMPVAPARLADPKLELSSVSLADMTAAKAIGVIKETYSEAQLLSWKKGEARKTVLDAIKDQLEFIALQETEAEAEEAAEGAETEPLEKVVPTADELGEGDDETEE